ncbi:MAG TPA: dihydrofolate reductase [Methylophilaceae bacterium]|nr:dihydrofolate reductase [Methylophilaceae bacterium]
MSQLSIIVAVADNRVIGLNNTLPWHLPDDLKRFKALTMGHHIIMGRKTYESLGRLLPGRTTVIVTRNPHYMVDGAIVVNSLEDALEASQKDREVFLIGGAELYALGISFAQRLYITEIHAEYAGDAYFPTIDYSVWHEVTREQRIYNNDLRYSYVVYERVPSLKVSNC